AARGVLEQILAQGFVTRGWLGLDYRDPGPGGNGGELSSAPRGVQVTTVYRDFPAAAAGLQPGDLLLHLDDQPIQGQVDLRQLEASLAPGSTAVLDGLRAGVPFRTGLDVVQRPRRDGN